MDNMPNIIKIYKITNVINGKIYIGQTIRIGVQFDNYWCSGKIIEQSIKKYGKDNFTKEILMECDCQEDANEAEKFYINEFGSTDVLIGYNISIGGHTIMSGDKNPMYGKKHSFISKEKMKINGRWTGIKGSNNLMFGKKFNIETRVKMAIKATERMNKLTPEERMKRAKYAANKRWSVNA